MDGIHPVDIEDTTLINVDHSSLLWIHRPDISLITAARCVDMDCDGLKKVLLTDLDGSFLGEPGVAFSQSEWQWNNRSRGLGDYRIPIEALVDSNDRYKNMTDVYTYTGIVRDEQLCSLENDWEAWHCTNMTMKLLVIESMDSDAETRRLSPIGIFSDNRKYIDLINGPASKYATNLRLITCILRDGST